MVDYGITLSPDEITTAAFRSIEPLPNAPRPSFNQTCLSEVTQTPIAVNVETKAEGGDQNEALAQLTVWVYAQYKRLQKLMEEAGHEPVVMPVLPSVIAIGGSWHVYFFWMGVDEGYVSAEWLIDNDRRTKGNMLTGRQGVYVSLNLATLVWRWKFTKYLRCSRSYVNGQRPSIVVGFTITPCHADERRIIARRKGDTFVGP